MKYPTLILTLVLSAPAAAQDYLAILSPFGTKAQVQAQVPMLQKQLAQMQAGDTLSVLNGKDGETITTFTVPDVPQAHKVRAIQGYNKQPIAKIRQFIASASMDHSTGALDLPQVLGQVATYHRQYQDILLLGSLSFDVPGVNPSIASGDLLPADSNLLKESSSSTFGTRNIAERLKGFRFHWWISQKSGSQQYQQEAIRFWHLWLHHQGSEVISITSDHSVVLKRLKDNAPALPMSYEMQSDEQAALQPTLFERELTKPSDATKWQQHQKVSVAIRWVGSGIDLDIYTMLPGQSKPVYYANGNTAHAKHLKDVRSAPQGKPAFYETIVYHKVIDSCQLLAAVNFYSGNSSNGVQGHIRIAMGDAVFEKPFALSATEGNKGADIAAVLSSRDHSRYSVAFTLADIAGDTLAARCHV